VAGGAQAGGDGYNLDGSRAMVMRDDALNGTHWDVYAYDPVSGRLASVTDTVPQPDVVHSFAWNPEGTLARWSSNEPNSYARVFGYDEEGRLTKIERDYGSGGVQVAYEYGYNSDGVRVWKRDVRNGQEYRYVCRIGCGGVPMRVYNRVDAVSWGSIDILAIGSLAISSSGLLHKGMLYAESISDANGNFADRFLVDTSGQVTYSESFYNSVDDGITETAFGILGLPRFQLGLGQPSSFSPHRPPTFPVWWPDPNWPFPKPFDPIVPLPDPLCVAACDKAYDTCRALAEADKDRKLMIWNVLCAGGVGGGVAACIALCTKIPSPWCWPICLAVVVLVAIGCAFAYNQIMNQYEEQLRNCYDKWFACIQGCVPRPKGCQIGPQVPMVCPVY
jgi:hypothetical protein